MRPCTTGTCTNPWGPSSSLLRERVCGSRRNRADEKAGEAVALFLRARKEMQRALDAEPRFRHGFEPLMNPGRGRRWRIWEDQVCRYLDCALNWDAILVEES